jgi:Cu+-exporting ATPase
MPPTTNHADDAPESIHPATPNQPAMPVRLRVDGMTCGSCVARVERALKSVPGVTDARVNLTTETAEILYTADGDPSKSLIEAVRQAGYDAQRVHSGAEVSHRGAAASDVKLQQQRQAMAQAIGLSLPVFALEWLGPTLQSSHHGAHVWWRVLQGLLVTMMILSPAGAPLLVAGLRAIWKRTPNMDLLVTLGVGAAYVSSAAALAIPEAAFHHFHAAAMILAFINIGKYFELKARREAAGAVAALAQRMPKRARRARRAGDESSSKGEDIPVSQITRDDWVQIVEDEVVPVDGIVVEGSAAVDQSAITGESNPVGLKMGDTAVSGSILREGSLIIQATVGGNESTMARIIAAVESAQTGKTRYQRIADQVAGVFVPIVVAIAVLTLIGWLIAGAGFTGSIVPAVAVLVIACPCAMGLATPTAVLVATGSAALKGILVRDAESLETAGAVTCVLLDKTGTLTSGRMTVSSIDTQSESLNENDLLRLAASVEQFSRHPIARAIVEEARRRQLQLADVEAYSSEAGFGVSGKVNESKVLVGAERYLTESGVDVSTPASEDRAGSAALVAVDGRLAGRIELNDTIRKSAGAAVVSLKELGVAISLVTGDRHSTAKFVAHEVGIESIAADVTPVGKQESVESRQREGHVVAFVGDGVNDAPALATADVGIAFAAGTDVAAAAANITLLSENLGLVPEAIRIARRSRRIIKQNLFWAFFYNILALPLAATGHISPGIAAGAMMMSSISVVLNALRLRR